MANISEFKAQMRTGGARPNQFRVELTMPPAAGSLGALAGQAAQFLCWSTTLPASTFDVIPTMYRGRPVNQPGERTFAPWTVSIYNENDFLIREALEQWSNAILSLSSTNGSVYSGEYQVDMAVHQLDRNDNIIKTYRFIDAMPVDVGAIQLSFDNNTTIETFDTTFVFNYFVTDTIA